MNTPVVVRLNVFMMQLLDEVSADTAASFNAEKFLPSQSLQEIARIDSELVECPKF